MSLRNIYRPSFGNNILPFFLQMSSLTCRSAFSRRPSLPNHQATLFIFVASPVLFSNIKLRPFKRRSRPSLCINISLRGFIIIFFFLFDAPCLIRQTDTHTHKARHIYSIVMEYFSVVPLPSSKHHACREKDRGFL